MQVMCTRLIERMWAVALQRSGAGLTRSSKILNGEFNGTRAVYGYTFGHEVTCFMEPETSSPRRRSEHSILPALVQCIHLAQALFILDKM
jgi:hypothetical protein